MADNVTLNGASGTYDAAADEISGVKHQRVKLQVGADGTATDVADTAPCPVTQGASATVVGLDTIRSVVADEAPIAVKGSAGRLHKVIVAHRNAHTVFLQIYNVAAGSVTVGTTTPKLTIPVPPGDGSTSGSGVFGQANEAFNPPVAFDTAISFAVTTEPNNATGPSENCTVNVLYK